MIKYLLNCKSCSLEFESWFASSKEFDKLKKLNLTGTKGDISFFSFKIGKYVTGGSGGMIVVNNKQLLESVKIQNETIINSIKEKM